MIAALLNMFSATVANDCTGGGFFGLVPWWHYLPKADFGGSGFSACDLNNQFSPFSSSGIPLILLAVVDDLLRIAGILAVGYMLYGAVLYATSQGSPEQTSKALQTIINSLIGVAISIAAVAFVSFLGSQLGS